MSDEPFCDMVPATLALSSGSGATTGEVDALASSVAKGQNPPADICKLT